MLTEPGAVSWNPTWDQIYQRHLTKPSRGAPCPQPTRARLIKEGLSAHLVTGDLVDLDGYYLITRFDAVIDVGSVQHNPLGPAKRILDHARSLLKQGVGTRLPEVTFPYRVA